MPNHFRRRTGIRISRIGLSALRILLSGQSDGCHSGLSGGHCWLLHRRCLGYQLIQVDLHFENRLRFERYRGRFFGIRNSGCCRLRFGRTGRHLELRRDWNRNRNVEVDDPCQRRLRVPRVRCGRTARVRSTTANRRGGEN